MLFACVVTTKYVYGISLFDYLLDWFRMMDPCFNVQVAIPGNTRHAEDTSPNQRVTIHVTNVLVLKVLQNSRYD